MRKLYAMFLTLALTLGLCLPARADVIADPFYRAAASLNPLWILAALGAAAAAAILLIRRK